MALTSPMDYYTKFKYGGMSEEEDPAEQRVRDTFAQLGMTDTPQLSPAQSAYQKATSAYSGVLGAEQETPPPAFVTDILGDQETPEYLDKRNSGFWQQFAYGVGSPVIDTLSMFGVLEPRPMPEGIGGYAGNILGSIVGWSALGMLTGGLGPVKALVARGGAAAITAGKGIAAASRGVIGAQAGGMIAKGAIAGGLSNLHWALGQRMWEDEAGGLGRLAKETLVGTVIGGAFGGIGAGISKGLQQAGKIPKTTSSLVDDYATRVADRMNPEKMLSIDDPKSMAGALLGDLDEVGKRRLPQAIDDILFHLDQANNPLPSTVYADDFGAAIGYSQFKKLPLKDQVEKVVSAIGKDPDAESLLKPILSLREASLMRKLPSTISRGRKLEDSLFREISKKTSTTPRSVDLPMESLGPKATKYLQEYDDALMFGDRQAAFSKLRRQLATTKREIFKDFGEDLSTAPYDAIKKVSDMEQVVQDLTWDMGNHIQKVLDRSPDVALPAYNQIRSKKLSDFTLKALKAEAREGDMGEFVRYHPELEDILIRANQKANAGLRGNKYKAGNFLPEEFQTQWNNKIKELAKRGDSATIIQHPYASVPVDENITKGGVNEWILNLKKIPDNTPLVGMSMADEDILRSPITKLTAILAPGRGIMGENQFRVLRGTGMKYNTAKNKASSVVREIKKSLGVNSFAKEQEVGSKISKLLEGIDDAPITTNLNTASRPLARTLISAADDASLDDVIEAVARGTKIKPAEVRKITSRVANIVGDESKMKIINNSAKALGTTPDDIVNRILVDHLYTYKLKIAGNTSRSAAKYAADFGTDPETLRAARKARLAFDKLFEQSGLDADMYRAAYFPHFRAMAGKPYETAYKQFKEIGLPKKTISSIFWANEMQRKGTATFNDNFFASYERYVSGMYKQKYYEPVFNQLDKQYKSLGLHNTRKDVYESLKEVIKGVPSDTEKMMDNAINGFVQFLGKQPETSAFGARPSQAIGAMLAELQYTSGMGFNPFMPIRNLTQKALAFTSITDSGNPLEGLTWMAKYKIDKAKGTGWARYLNEFNDVAYNRIYLEGLDLQPRGIVNAARRFGLSDTAAAWGDDLANNWAMKMFKWSDRSNVEDVFGARMYYLLQQKGAPLADAVELARSTTMATQFMYGLDSPMLYKTPIGKQIGIFQSWPLNWAQMLWDQGTQGSMQRAVGTVATMAVASELLTMTGLSFRSIHPTETVRGILPVQMLEGERKFPLALRVFSSVHDYMNALASSDDQAMDLAFQNFYNHAEGLIPFGVVTRRTLQFIDRARHGWRDYTDPGFLTIKALSPQTRQGTERLRHNLYPSDEMGQYDPTAGQPKWLESTVGLIGTTTKSVQRYDDWAFGAEMDSAYRKTRRQAVDSFLMGDYDKFQQLQEQLVLNFGRWIEPKDIINEMDLMQQTARDRQVRSLPTSIKEPYLEQLRLEGR
jgi:hypothetical protein